MINTYDCSISVPHISMFIVLKIVYFISARNSKLIDKMRATLSKMRDYNFYSNCIWRKARRFRIRNITQNLAYTIFVIEVYVPSSFNTTLGIC